jgi:hypothetical protein
VRNHRDGAGSTTEVDCFMCGKPLAWCVRRSSRTEKAFESLRDILDVAFVNHYPGKVRSTDHATARFCVYFLDSYVEALRPQLVGNLEIALVPGSTQIFHALLKRSAVRVEEIDQHVHALVLPGHRQFGATDKAETGRRRQACSLGYPLEGVVVREGDPSETDCDGTSDDFRRRIGTIRTRAVQVQINCHQFKQLAETGLSPDGIGKKNESHSDRDPDGRSFCSGHDLLFASRLAVLFLLGSAVKTLPFAFISRHGAEFYQRDLIEIRPGDLEFCGAEVARNSQSEFPLGGNDDLFDVQRFQWDADLAKGVGPEGEFGDTVERFKTLDDPAEVAEIVVETGVGKHDEELGPS